MLFKFTETEEIYLLFIGLIYNLLPMKEINEYFFYLHDEPEEVTYEESEMEFDTVIHFLFYIFH